MKKSILILKWSCYSLWTFKDKEFTQTVFELLKIRNSLKQTENLITEKDQNMIPYIEIIFATLIERLKISDSFKLKICIATENNEKTFFYYLEPLFDWSCSNTEIHWIRSLFDCPRVNKTIRKRSVRGVCYLTKSITTRDVRNLRSKRRYPYRIYGNASLSETGGSTRSAVTIFRRRIEKLWRRKGAVAGRTLGGREAGVTGSR